MANPEISKLVDAIDSYVESKVYNQRVYEFQIKGQANEASTLIRPKQPDLQKARKALMMSLADFGNAAAKVAVDKINESR